MIFSSEPRIGAVPSGFFLFDVLDRLLERPDERLRVSQVAFSHLEFRDQHTVFIDKDQTIALFHSDALYVMQREATR